MTVQPYDNGTFLVASHPNRPPYLVDLWFKEEKWSKPKPVCGCPDCFAKGFKPCKHILWLVNHLLTT
jgi:hypothetical protein